MRHVWSLLMSTMALGACGSPSLPSSLPSSAAKLTSTSSIMVRDPGPITRFSASPTPLPAWPAWEKGDAELYNVDEDPERASFGTDPRSHRTDWQATVTRPGGRACRTAHEPVLHVTMTFWFLDDRQGHWFAQKQTLALRCGRSASVRPTKTRHGTSGWLFLPEPPVNGPRDAQGVVRPPEPLNPGVDRLPLALLWIGADRPGSLRVRWRSRTVAGEISPWSSQQVALPSDPPAWFVPGLSGGGRERESR